MIAVSTHFYGNKVRKINTKYEISLIVHLLYVKFPKSKKKKTYLTI